MKGQIFPIVLALSACHPNHCPESGTVCTVLGDGTAGYNGDGLKAKDTRLYYPTDVVWQPGTERYVIVDWNNERIRQVDEEGEVLTVVGRDLPGDGATGGGDRVEPGALGDAVSLNHPVQAEFSPDGVLYIAAWHNHKVRRWDPETGRVMVVVANTDPEDGNVANAGFGGDGGPAEDALLWFPSSIAFEPDGSYVIVDVKNERLRRVSTDGVIDTIAGSGTWGFADGPLLEAQFAFPDNAETSQPQPSSAIEIDEDGVIYVSDTFNHRIRKVDLLTGQVTTLAGTGDIGFSGDGGPAIEALFDRPHDIELGPDGRLYVADTGNHRIRAIDLEDGTIETVVGTGDAGDAENRTPALEAPINQPYGLEFADDGALWIADTFNSKVRRVTP